MTLRTLLVVDDDLLNRRLLVDLLRLQGHNVIAEASVESALRTLGATTVDVVVADAQMPGGGGKALLQSIRQSLSMATLPVVVVTAQAMVGDRERFLDAGFDAYVSKPIDIKTFIRTIDALLEGVTPAEG